MRLENIACGSEEARKALDKLPDGTVDKGIIGIAEYHKEGIQNKSNVPSVQLFIESGLYSVDAPKGSKEFRATFTEKSRPYASFVYKGVDYIFINAENK